MPLKRDRFIISGKLAVSHWNNSGWTSANVAVRGVALGLDLRLQAVRLARLRSLASRVVLRALRRQEVLECLG